MIECLARELLTRLSEQLTSDSQLQRVLQRCSGGAVRHRPSDYQQLLGSTQLVLGLAAPYLSGNDLMCAWFVLRQEFANLTDGKPVSRARLKWLRTSLLEQVQQ